MIYKICKKHGYAKHSERAETNSYRCCKCASESVTKRKQKKKLMLVEEFGGKCSICGYGKCIAALQFHHLNPEVKEMALSSTHNVSYERMRAEAEKCILICANCHAEIHYG